MLSFLRLERKQKISSNVFRTRIFILRYYSFRMETINTFIHSRSSLENHTRFQTKMSKVYTRFQTKKTKTPSLLGGIYLYGLHKGVPASRGTKIERDLTTFLRFSSQLLSDLRANSWLKEWSWARKGGSENGLPHFPSDSRDFFSQTDQLLNTEIVLP